MTEHAREPAFRREPPDYSDPAFGRLDRDLGFFSDPLLAVAYAISECAIAIVGPVFWICLAYLLLRAELGN